MNTQASAGQAECQRFIDTFGAKGGEWFAADLTFEQAQAEYCKVLVAENAELRQRLHQAGVESEEQSQAGKAAKGIGP